ncbi:oxidoreductase [Aspergillus eucalypticola CBS 122712]|uniref:Oxidoreductase n=1 Tax=Aspergillus eucalypticola (strain CBS 122712 / IBT 29274) TaxID=1448314 RepID=A0A317V031_ASPEC|nr:oxidoreductase [Aspergillus eucalypticola CBS 122712]PWY65550.1 oxidoreductase [Aspergillus eucalypticola CBS 122712]
MPTNRYFAQAPPFPADTPTIDLPVLSFSDLRSGNPTEGEKLFAASREWGFFLIDLHDSAEGRTLLHDAEAMFDLDIELFSLDQTTLDQYAYNAPKDLTGYKRMGALKTDDGKLDHMHLYNINQDDILGNRPPRTNAPPIEAQRPQIQNFIRHASSALDVILKTLDDHLGLERGTLSKLSPLDQESETSVRLLCSPPHASGEANRDRISLGGHTDIGTTTLLFHIIGGLQILPAGLENKMENWRFVRPVPGCALVNIGDALVEWTGQLLRSSLHRVLAAPGEQAFVPRRSVAYLVRPAKSASMRRIRGGKIPVLTEGEEEETRSVDEWAAWRSKQVMLGLLKPQTRGGVVPV